MELASHNQQGYSSGSPALSATAICTLALTALLAFLSY